MAIDWKNAWRKHIKDTSDFWVDRSLDRSQGLDEDEQAVLLRKKESLEKRGSKILKATANGRVISHQRVGEENHVFYRNHLQLLIKQDDNFYIEEHDVEKTGIFQDGLLKRDLTRDQEVVQANPPRILFAQDENRAGNESRISYDRMEAVKYAEKWWDRENPAYPAFKVDCTNYVSQCLRAGGAPKTHMGVKNKGWWCDGKECSYSWSVAHSLRWYLSSKSNSLNAVEVDSPDQLVPGDVICYDWNGDDTWDHNTIVVDLDEYGMPLVNAHTANSRYRYWAYEDSPAYTDQTQYKFFHINDD